MLDAFLCYLDLEMTLLKCTVSAVSVDSSAAGDQPAFARANLPVSFVCQQR